MSSHFLSHKGFNYKDETHLDFLPEYGKTPSVHWKGVYHTRYSGLLGHCFVQLLGQTSLFPIGGILMNNALGRGLIDHCGSRGKLLIGVLRISGNSGVKLPDGSTHPALNDAVAKILLLADLNALLCGLDIRQLGSPPLRILKKPSHEIISR